jgi:hypothetical protein
MQTAALLQKPMHLGEGFGDYFDFNFDEMDNLSSDIISEDYIYIPGEDVDAIVDSYFDFAVVDTSGNVNTESGQPLITADQLGQIATANPGREAVAVAQSLQVTAPNWAKQFKSYDDIVRAAAGLFTTVKAVVTGQPIPRSQSPYVYGPGQTPAYRPSSGLTTTHMLLIGGAALAAILLLRRK